MKLEGQKRNLECKNCGSLIRFFISAAEELHRERDKKVAAELISLQALEVAFQTPLSITSGKLSFGCEHFGLHYRKPADSPLNRYAVTL